MISTSMAFLTRVISHISRKGADLQTVRTPVTIFVSLIGTAIMGAAIMQWRSSSDRSAFDVTYEMLACGGFAVLMSGLTLASPRRERQAGAWILIGTAALAVVLASELYNKRPNARAFFKDEKAQPKRDMAVELPPVGSLLEETKVTRPAKGFLGVELQPSIAALFHGAPFHTNRWGMRDKDYEMKPPPGTCRIALLGASPELGSAVPDDQVWETILEDHLNRENDRKKVAQYEILNFAVGGYTPLQKLAALETKAFSFDPDIVFYVAHPADEGTVTTRLAQFVTRGTENPYDYLRQVIRQAGIEGETNVAAASRALRPYNNDIMSWIFRRIVELCRQRSIVPVYIFMPTAGASTGRVLDHFKLAKEAGFLIVDLSDLYRNRDKASLRTSDSDLHPNAAGHRLIADRLYKELRSNPALLQKLK
jgi:hypothetical protein